MKAGNAPGLLHVLLKLGLGGVAAVKNVMKAGNAPGLLHVSLKLGLGCVAAVKRCDESWKCSWIAACIIEVRVRRRYSSEEMR